MRAWSGATEDRGDIMGPTVTRAASPKATTPPLKNGNDLRESGYLIAVGSRTARFRRKHKDKMFAIVSTALISFLLCLAIVMTVLYVKLKRHKNPDLCETRECLRSASNLALSMDTTANPCHDFYQYACGNWQSEHPRPDAYRSYDWFREKQIRVYSLVRDFLSKNVTHARKPVQQAKDMYDACVDTEKLDKLGIKPIFQVLDKLGLPAYPTYINATEDFDYSAYKFDWLETVIKVKKVLGMDILIGFDVFTDPKNSSIYRLVMGSPETTNPFPSVHNEKKPHNERKKGRRKINIETFVFNNDHYFESKEHKDDDDKRVSKVYKLLYAELMKLFVIEAGDAKNTKLSETELDQNIFLASDEYFTVNSNLYELDTENDTESEDAYLNIPEYTVDEIQTHTDAIVESNNGTASPIWKKYLEGVFAISDVTLDAENDKILVSEPDLRYMALMASYVANTPPVVLELYIWVKVVEVMAVHTTTELRILFQRSYEEMRKGHSGTGLSPRAFQCAGVVNDMMGMAVAYAIADSHFLNVTKPKIQTMIHEMKNALSRLVGKAKWMDDDTKVATYQKIIKMKTLIGFPDWLHEDGKLEEYYEGVEVDRETHLQNMMNVIQVGMKKVLNKFREGNNFTWATDPTEVNAYHTFQENTITVPLVMLQHPFFDLGLDSLNYGSLGTVLGHEITHGFDNFGRQFDKNGNLLPWWSNDTINSFVNMTQCFVQQYSNYYLAELDEHVDGKQTLGENIADNGGLREALAALKEHLRASGPEKKLPGFERMTSEQLFFLSFGNVSACLVENIADNGGLRRGKILTFGPESVELWCGVSTKDSLESDLEDEHSPQQFRAIGALQNSEEFARAWRCPPGSPMNPAKRCIIF